jgi:hypothetical protein
VSGEYYAPCMLKTSVVIYEKEYVAAVLSIFFQ